MFITLTGEDWLRVLDAVGEDIADRVAAGTTGHSSAHNLSVDQIKFLVRELADMIKTRDNTQQEVSVDQQQFSYLTMMAVRLRLRFSTSHLSVSRVSATNDRESRH